MRQITINRRYCGPPRSANGGYVCGLLARYIEGPAEVTLRIPPPLGRPLEVVQDAAGGILSLLDGDQTVAVARATRLESEAPPSVSFEIAKAASARTPVTPERHQLPTCFVCGPQRHEGDGMRLFAGPVENDDDTFAVPWVPDQRFPHEDGRPREELVWAALDCPTGYATYASAPDTILLGRMSVHVKDIPSLGEKCVITAKVLNIDGRKITVNGALYGHDERCLAVAQNTWIVVAPEVQKGMI